MTLFFNKHLLDSNKPLYLALADAIAQAVSDGELKSGEKLPTHRDLAFDLGVTVGTVTRAYIEAEKRGLLKGEVGRGTFVQKQASNQNRFDFGRDVKDGMIDLSFNLPPVSSIAEEQKIYSKTLSELSQRFDLLRIMHYQPTQLVTEYRDAGVQWLNLCGVCAKNHEVLITSGSQHAIMVVLGALSRPGDEILTEMLTFPGLKMAAQMFHLRTTGITMDDEGILPGSLETACKKGSAKFLYIVPTIQNPTTATMTVNRRRQIAQIARKYKLHVIEDDIHTLLSEKRFEPISNFYPENTFYISNTSKLLAPALRIAYLRSPEPFIDQLISAIQASIWMTSPLGAAIASEWINSSVHIELLETRRKESIQRHNIARRVLNIIPYKSYANGYHLWMDLPEPWRVEDFVSRLAHRGVMVSSSDAFVVGRRVAPHAVRISLGGAQNQNLLEKGLNILAETLVSKTKTRGLV